MLVVLLLWSTEHFAKNCKKRADDKHEKTRIKSAGSCEKKEKDGDWFVSTMTEEHVGSE